ncbi:MAG: rod shape-determining protein MreC [Candidatus Krumholzibacteriales bacterium]
MAIFSYLFDTHRDKTVLAIAVILSILMLNLDEESKVHSAREFSSFLLAPVEKAQKYFADLDSLRAENDKLREVVAALSYERSRLLHFKQERERMRNLLNFRRDSHYRFLPCEVIAMSSNVYHHSVTVDRGSNDGILKGMPVVGYRGVVGRIIQVFPSSSRVILINNNSVSVSCRDRRSRVIGVLRWDYGNYFNLDYVSKDEDVMVGDTLVTSGLGKAFPGGFPVGIVFSIRDEEERVSRRVRVVSMADLGTVEELFIVMSSDKWDYSRIVEEIRDTEGGL